MDKEIVSIAGRYSAAASEAMLWLPLYERVYRYVLPQKNTWFKPITGQERLPPLYDSTAIVSLNQFVGQCLATLLPEDYQFIKISPGRVYDFAEDLKAEADDFFAELTDYFFELLHASNFYQVRAEFLKEWAGPGTGTLIFNENDDDENPFMFHIAPLTLLAFEQGPTGDIRTVFRKHEQFNIANIKQHWPMAELTSDMKRTVAEDYTAKIDLIESIIWVPEDKNYRYMLSTVSYGEILMDYREKSSPAIVTRFDVTTGELFGRGLGVEALEWVELINTIYRDEIAQGELATNPPTMGFADSVVNLNLVNPGPGAFVPVKPGPDGRTFPVAQWPTQSNFSFTQAQIADIRVQIERLFFADVPMTQPNHSPVTATELMIRNKKAQERFGVPYSRFGAEFYRPFMKRAMHIMNSRGLLPKVNIGRQEKDIDIDGFIGKVTFAPPLANADGFRKAEALQNYIMLMSPIYGENTAATLNVAKLPEDVSQWFNLPPDLAKNEQQMTNAIQQYAKAVEEAQRKQQLGANPVAPKSSL